MKKIIFLLAAVTMFAAACDNNNDDGKKDDDQTTTDFVMDNVKVEVLFADDHKTADIKMLQVKFADAMPVTLDITIPGVTVSGTDGAETLSGDDIVPTMNTSGGAVPVPLYTITGLTGSVSASALTLSMIIGEYPTAYSGTDAAGDGTYTGTVTVK